MASFMAYVHISRKLIAWLIFIAKLQTKKENCTSFLPLTSIQLEGVAIPWKQKIFT